MDGWIKLHRKTMDNPIVCKDADHLAVWIYLLTNATHKEYPAVFAGEKIMLQPGQLITGRKTIGEKFSVHESKVQRILKKFETEQQIEQRSSNNKRLISILSWADYQSSEQQNEQQMNNQRTTDEQPVNTNKNVKNLINISTTTTTEPLQDVWLRLTNKFVMPSNLLDYFSKLRANGYDESFCTELLQEAFESANNGSVNMRYLESISDRWIASGISSRQQAKDRRAKHAEHKVSTQGIQSGGNPPESKFAFLNQRSRRSGT
ncbi:DnaD domain protein [Paenibacillus sp. FSL R5-0486]|uniref:DnaD domain protein n=1 Tax=Paenibacillus sp. FSL R5-0486 TaxID=2921645 RepID=UPI0030D96B23